LGFGGIKRLAESNKKDLQKPSRASSQGAWSWEYLWSFKFDLSYFEKKKGRRGKTNAPVLRPGHWYEGEDLN